MLNKKDIDKLPNKSGFSAVYSSISQMFWGIDHAHAGSFIQKNTDTQGLTFFTRPYLNLSYNNVLADRRLLYLLDQNDTYSVYRAIRVMLDSYISSNLNTESPVLRSNLVDYRSAFIPILTNTLESLSGFPDITLNTYQSSEGVRKEAWKMVDDVAEINSPQSLTATFKNIKGDPISTLFTVWTIYMGNVYSGRMVPYPDMVVNNTIDYQTRIWRIILDRSKKYVTKIGCAIACFPTAAPLGSAFDYSKDTPFSTNLDQISIPFECVGFEYNDPILISEFNVTVAMYNRAMSYYRREKEMVLLDKEILHEFNFNGYPYITENLEFQWWMHKDEYNAKISALQL